MKIASVKSVKKIVCQWYVYTPKSQQEHPACPIFSVGEGTERRGRLINVCGAPRCAARRGNNRLWSP